jgi:hypothetical protein
MGFDFIDQLIKFISRLARLFRYVRMLLSGAEYDPTLVDDLLNNY